MKKVLFLLISLALVYIAILLYPSPFFSHKLEVFGQVVYSDQEIPKEMLGILDDVRERIKKSEFYTKEEKYKIFICNDSWRLFLFTRSTKIGGAVNFFSPNIFIRKSNIEQNKIITQTEIYTPKERPLSYFIAHEIIHVMQQKVSPLLLITKPTYIVEGYADYIAKAPNFDYDRYLNDYKTNTHFMNPSKSGMYNKYHLLIAFLMDKKGMTYHEILQKSFSMQTVEAMMEDVK